MTDIALLWRPEQAEALRTRLAPDVRTMPLSQKSCAAASAAQLPNLDVRYFDVLQDIDLSALRSAADDAVRARESAGGSTLDRPAVWHNAHETAFVRAAAQLMLLQDTVRSVTCVSDPDEPEVVALTQICTAHGVHLDNIALARPSPIAATLSVPADLVFSDAHHASDSRPWRFILAVALADLGDQMRKAAKTGAVVLAVDADASGEAGAIQSLARAVWNTKILSLSTDGAAYRERGDNTAYAAEVERQLARAFVRAPVQVIISDLRRVETELAVRAAPACGLRPILRAHGGGVMETPYRFEDADVARSVWTNGARQLDHADFVESPRTLRPPLPHRLARLALRADRLLARPRIGVVVTTGELFAAPESHLAPMIEAFGKLCAAAGDADVILRLRRLEDCGDVWSAALPGAKFAIETRDDRPFIPFARSCDLIVELGAESSAQLEAAANGVPCVRIDAPPAWLRRFLREGDIVPQLAVAQVADLLRSPARCVALGLRQYPAVERDTRPA